MVSIILIFLQTWVTPIKITPDSTPLTNFEPPLVTSDHQGKIWFAWQENHWAPIRSYTLARYYESGILSEPDTVMPENLVFFLQGLTRDRNGNIWVLGDDDWEIWTRFYDGTQWSDTIPIPIFPSCNHAATGSADSAGNYWVAWCTGYFGLHLVYSCYYNGVEWSPQIQVSDIGDSWPYGMATSGNGRLWLVWGCLNGNPDSLYVSTYNGANWSTDFSLDGDIEIRGAFITSSLTDSSIFVSYRKGNGTFYVLRFVSNNLPPETLWLNSEFETAPVMICDDLGQLWLFFCDSLNQYDYRLYYAIWGGDSVTSPQLVDTGNAYDPRTTFDPFHRRIWVTYKDAPVAAQAIYATYTDLEGISEEKLFIVQPKISLICAPNPMKNDCIINYVILRKEKFFLNLYDNSGRLVKKIFNGEKTPGTYSEKISLKEYPNGVYHLLLRTLDVIIKRKVVHVK